MPPALTARMAAAFARMFERTIEANPRPSVADPRLYDPGLAPMLPFPFSDLRHIGSPVPERSWDVVRRALEEDRETGRLPWGRLIRLPAADHPDQPDVRIYFVTWRLEGGTWVLQDRGRVSGFEVE